MILRPSRRSVTIALITSTAAIAVAIGPPSPAVSAPFAQKAVTQPFVQPTAGTISSNYEEHTNRPRPSRQPGVDIRDLSARPNTTAPPACIVEPGSVTAIRRTAATTGDWDSDGRCNDYQGPPVFASSFGKIEKLDDGGQGNDGHNITIYHGKVNGQELHTYYLHLGTKARDASDTSRGQPVRSFINPALRVGACVGPGTLLGYQGFSGNTTGTHLHYSLSLDRAYQDPQGWTPSQAVVQAPADCPILKLTLEGPGSGRVTSAPQGIDCTTIRRECLINFPQSTAVTLTATADTNSSFVGWEGDVVSCPATSNVCQVTMDASRTVTARFKGISDLAITKAASPDPATVDDVLTYTIGITNGGPAAALAVKVFDELPAGVDLVSASSNQGTCVPSAPPLPAGRVVECSVGTLAAGGTGASATVTIVVRPTSAGSVSNMARVVGDVYDPNVTNNVITISTTVEVPATVVLQEATYFASAVCGDGNGRTSNSGPHDLLANADAGFSYSVGVDCSPAGFAQETVNGQVTLGAANEAGERPFQQATMSVSGSTAATGTELSYGIINQQFYFRMDVRETGTACLTPNSVSATRVGLFFGVDGGGDFRDINTPQCATFGPGVHTFYWQFLFDARQGQTSSLTGNWRLSIT